MSTAGRGAAALLLITPLAGQLSAQDSSAVRSARITYLAGTSAYLDAGRLDGLREGAQLSVVRGGVVVGVLKVAYLASHRSSCTIVSSTVPLAAGDVVRFAPAAVPRDSSVVARAAPPAKAAPVRAHTGGLRGRIGMDYFALWQRGATGGTLADPALQLRLDGAPAGADALTLAVDVRARRTHTILPDGSASTDGRNRVYQAALSWNEPGSTARVTFGRQISPILASVGLFDGALAEVRYADWSSGVFTGTEPEPLALGWSGSVVEGGAYAQRHSRVGARTQWALTVGASGSYQDTHANREFAFVQGSLASERVSTFLIQEADYYRPWKLLPGMRAVSPTSTFAVARVRATTQLNFEAGFDNRRNVRLYRDVINPATSFDDTFRQGAWGGVSVEVTRRLRLGLEARSSSGGPAGSADAYTLSIGADRLTPLGVSLRTRTTRYTNPQLHGWLEAAALSVDPDTRVHLELNGGVRAERDTLADPPSFTVTWVGGDIDVTLSRAWYLTLLATRQRGGTDSYDDLFVGLSIRF